MRWLLSKYMFLISTSSECGVPMFDTLKPGSFDHKAGVLPLMYCIPTDKLFEYFGILTVYSKKYLEGCLHENEFKDQNIISNNFEVHFWD